METSPDLTETQRARVAAYEALIAQLLMAPQRQVVRRKRQLRKNRSSRATEAVERLISEGCVATFSELYP